VTVNMEGFHEDPVRVLLPFPGLQQYAAWDTLDSHFRTLALASNLVECAVDVDHSSDISVPPAKLVVLPHLLRLFLQNSKLLDCLDTPQLEELYCSGQSNHLSPKLGPYKGTGMSGGCYSIQNSHRSAGGCRCGPIIELWPCQGHILVLSSDVKI
jgi:hypothetical protein